MNREVLTFETEAQWLAMREQDLTSTEVAALFGCSPYLSELELYHQKRGELKKPFEVNTRMVWGNRLEAAIAYGIAEDFGLVVEPFKVYMRIPEARLGSSFDFKVVGLAEGYKGDETYRNLFKEHGPGAMEVKNVDGLAFRRSWIADNEEPEAPLHIEFQIQHQLEVADLNWSLVAPLIGGNTPFPFYRLRDRETADMVQEKAAAFWNRVATGNAPTPDYARDLDTIRLLNSPDDGTEVDMSDNKELAELIVQYNLASAQHDVLAKERDALKARMFELIGRAKKATAGGFYISAGQTKPSMGTLITPEMVGTHIGGRSGFRNFRIYAAKPAKPAKKKA